MEGNERDRTGKVLFVGLAESGKTTIIRTLIEGSVPENIGQYSATLNYERKHLTHLEKKITIFDLGGQINFLDRYTGELAQFIFSKASALVFIVDSANVSELTRVKYYLDLAVNRIARYSPETPVYVLLHKIDLLNPHMEEELAKNLRIFLKSDLTHPLTFYETSIVKNKGESVFKAFNTILGKISGKGDQVSVLEEKESLTPEGILRKFAREYPEVVVKSQLLAESGTPLIKGTRDFTHISKFDIRRVLDNALQYVANNIEVTNSMLIESDYNVHYVQFLNSGRILFVTLSKEGISKRNENIPSIYDKITAIAKQIEENR